MAKQRENPVSQKPLTSTMEDYVEAIFNLGNEKRTVRVKDIAKKIGVKMPTVTNMLKTLSMRELINYEKYEYVELTKKGTRVGKEIYRKHKALRSFLTNILKVEFKKADEEACRMEHTISASTLDRFVEFMNFVRSCPRAGSTWLEYFDEYRLHGQEPEKCIDRMKQFADGFGFTKNTIEKMKG